MTVRNTESARESLTSSDWYFYGFNGTEPLYNNTPGTYDNLNRIEQTKEYPWFTINNQCQIYVQENEDRRSRDGPQPGVVQVAIWRDFSTSWSDIELKVDQEIEMILGYRVYPGDTATSTVARGVSEPFRISISGAYFGLSILSCFILACTSL